MAKDEKDTIARRQLILEETRAKKIEAEDNRKKKILDITTKLRLLVLHLLMWTDC